MHILEKTDPALVERLKTTPTDIGKKAVLNACLVASKTVAGLEPEIKALLEESSKNSTPSKSQIDLITTYATSADERYFELNDKGRGAESMVWFSKARLATALKNIYSESSWEGVADAVYELTAMFDDPSMIIGTVKSELEK